jgi:hypothetical protein
MIHTLLLLFLLTNGSIGGNVMKFTASTPANKTVRDFLNISQGDSIDFIRWKLKIVDLKEFEFSCSYGISKANTNGFVNEKVVAGKGTAELKDGVLTVYHQGKMMSMLLLNQNIIHLLDTNGSMMVGNAGWSYTLNSITPLAETSFTIKSKNVSFTDSVVFDGRTPCKGIEELMDNRTRAECYKKKWRLSLYKDHSADISGSYKIGTVGARTGKWKLIENSTGRPVYSLDLNNGNTLDLFHVDENIVYIMDKKGSIMVGDHDFSYSLNRKN